MLGLFHLLYPDLEYRAAARRGSTCGHGGLRPARGGAAAGSTASQGGRLQDARKGLSPATNPAAIKGDGVDRRGGRLLAGWLPAGKDNRRLRRGSGDDGAEGARGKIGFPFVKKTILPL
ncbi:hypothetical protein GW17_00039422 [Ensete ventricosum]|nr:hypothetical protein GW17_00039422 [Ensete ventricosum]RZS26795.1 hypothetical protein BHM03_00060213 [Ensete ventricosum]